jgi:hypothetical protein
VTDRPAELIAFQPESFFQSEKPSYLHVPTARWWVEVVKQIGTMTTFTLYNARSSYMYVGARWAKERRRNRVWSGDETTDTAEP